MRTTKLFLSISLLAALDSAADPTRWRDDLRFLFEELEARHANLYHSLSRHELQREVRDLEQKLPKLSDDQVILEIARILARVGDGHTGLFLPWSRGLTYRKLPLELFPAKDGWMILAASPEYADLAGAKVLEIGNKSTDDVVRALLPHVSHDNEFGRRSDVREYFIPEVLRTLGFVSSADEVPLRVEDMAGNVRRVAVRPVERQTQIEWRQMAARPVWLRNRQQKYWSEYLPPAKMLYVQFNSADIGRGDPERQFASFTDGIVRDVEVKDVERLVLDLRWNAGGSFYRTRYLLWALIRSEKINQPGKLFVLIGPHTFSAGTALATEIDWHTRAIFVGEPTGGSPNAYGDIGRFRLPNSNIEIRYSRYYMQQSFTEDRRPAIFPELRAEPTIDDMRKGRDPALEAVEKYRGKSPLRDHISMLITRDGVSQAIAAYEQLKRERYNEIEFDEDQLDAVGRQLLQDKNVEAAIAIFELNTREYPWSGDVWVSLGDALLQKGDRPKALDAYRRAFELDKRNAMYRDLLRAHP